MKAKVSPFPKDAETFAADAARRPLQPSGLVAANVVSHRRGQMINAVRV